MTHLDLFSGIGGFAYAADQVWGDVTHIFCDNDKFCQAVLKKHWPESEVYDDIRKITTDPYRTGLQGENEPAATHSDSTGCVDLLTGGFPCQPFSAAGLRRGTADDRHFWPEMLRVIRLATPRWVIAENVHGLLTWDEGVQFEECCADLEAAGYEVQPVVIPAAAVGAPHRRDRVWIIATDTAGHQRQSGMGLERKQDRQDAQPSLSDRDASDSVSERRGRRRDGDSAGSRRPLQTERPDRWNADWAKIAAELCSVDDGLPARMGGLELSKAQHRNRQIKAYGNAIVPQVAIEIMQAIRLCPA